MGNSSHCSTRRRRSRQTLAPRSCIWSTYRPHWLLFPTSCRCRLWIPGSSWTWWHSLVSCRDLMTLSIVSTSSGFLPNSRRRRIALFSAFRCTGPWDTRALWTHSCWNLCCTPNTRQKLQGIHALYAGKSRLGSCARSLHGSRCRNQTWDSRTWHAPGVLSWFSIWLLPALSLCNTYEEIHKNLDSFWVLCWLPSWNHLSLGSSDNKRQEFTSFSLVVCARSGTAWPSSVQDQPYYRFPVTSCAVRIDRTCRRAYCSFCTQVASMESFNTLRIKSLLPFFFAARSGFQTFQCQERE